jgi:hypothetical protein
MLDANTSYEDLLNAYLADAKQDAVAFQQIESWAARVMNLKNDDLDNCITRLIKDILLNGAMPVIGKLTGKHDIQSGLPKYVWIRHPDYALSDIDKCVGKIILDWKQMKIDFDFYVWFTFPQNILTN